MDIPDRIIGRDLHYVPFRGNNAVQGFECTNHELNEFLCTEQVEEYQRELFGKTTLVYYMPTMDLVGYYTTASGDLELQTAKKTKGIQPLLGMEAVPGILIGRLAVDKRWCRKGIGALMVKRIAIDAVQAPFAVRIIRLAAEPDSIGFYQRIGFEFATDRDNKNRRKPHMFMDIKKVLG